MLAQHAQQKQTQRTLTRVQLRVKFMRNDLLSSRVFKACVSDLGDEAFASHALGPFWNPVSAIDRYILLFTCNAYNRCSDILEITAKG